MIKKGGYGQPNESEIKALFKEATGGQESMTDAQLLEFVTGRLELSPEDPLIGHILVGLMGLKSIESVNYAEFRSLFTGAK